MTKHFAEDGMGGGEITCRSAAEFVARFNENAECYHRDAPTPGHPAAQLERTPDGTWRAVVDNLFDGPRGAFYLSNEAAALPQRTGSAGSLRSPGATVLAPDELLRALRELRELYADLRPEYYANLCGLTHPWRCYGFFVAGRPFGPADEMCAARARRLETLDPYLVRHSEPRL